MHIHVVVHPIHVLYVLLLVQILSIHVQRGTYPAGRLSLRGYRGRAREVNCNACTQPSYFMLLLNSDLYFLDIPLEDGAPHARKVFRG